MQQWRHGCSSEQHACVELQAAADGGTIAMDGRQSACVRQQAVDAACVQQHAAEWCVCDSVQRRRHMCGSGWEQPAVRLQWKTVMMAATAGGGGGAKSSG
jgi:hypothetical protein